MHILSHTSRASHAYMHHVNHCVLKAIIDIRWVRDKRRIIKEEFNKHGSEEKEIEKLKTLRQ